MNINTAAEIAGIRYDDAAILQRAARQRARAAGTVPSVTLDADHAKMLASILADTGETATAWVRRMIREQATRS